MITHSREEVEAALEVLQQSYSYDSPERWIGAYTTLAPIRLHLRAARKEYRWLVLVGVAAFVVSAATMFYFIATRDYLLVPFFGLAMFSVTPIFGGLATYLAERREPLLKLQGAIEHACSKFDLHRAVSDRKQQHVPA